MGLHLYRQIIVPISSMNDFTLLSVNDLIEGSKSGHVIRYVCWQDISHILSVGLVICSIYDQ